MRVRLRLERLRQLVAEGQLSQNHWALKLGISKGHWSAILSGRYPHPSPKTRVRLLEIFEAEFDELFEVVGGPQGDAGADFQAAIGDRYRIEREIGQGGMGTVYLARDVKRGRTVAVKVIAEEAISGVGLAQFVKETRYASRLQHPNILPIYDSGEAGGQPYYVTPFIESGSLRELLATRGAFPASLTAHIAVQIGRALSHAHERQILHCDVKPENILLVGSGADAHVYVADFGIARAIHAEALEWGPRGELDSSAGTPAYVSPEQASGETNLTPASDVYSMGCVLFEMLSGATPFQGTTTMETVAQRFVSAAPDVRRLVPSVSRRVATAVRQAMALDPAERIQQPTELAERIRTGAGARQNAFSFRVRQVASIGLQLGRRILPRPTSLRRVMFMDRLRQDLVFAFRSLFRRPAYAAVVLLTLALGIGMNTAVFSVIHGVLFRPLPVDDPGSVVRVGRTRPELPGVLLPISPGSFSDLAPNVRTLSEVAGETPRSFVFTDGAEAASFSGRLVTPGFLELLGVAPQIGRLFGRADGTPGAEPVAVLSNALWRNRFGADSSVVGRPVRINDEMTTVIGIMPRRFGFDNAQVWMPFRWSESDFGARNNNFLRIYGRLAPGASQEESIAELHGMWTRQESQFPNTYDESGMSVKPLHSALVENSTTPLLVLTGAVGFVLLIACANVTNLTLARAETRRREIAVRAAMGAGRGRLARQFFTESLLTAVIGGALGVVVGFAGVRGLIALFGQDIPRSDEIGINLIVLGFSLGVSVLTGLLVGLAPVLQSKPDHGALKEGVRGSSSTTTWFRKSLVAIQFALALMLVVGASLLLKSFWHVLESDLGFDQHNLSIATLWFPPSRFAESTERQQFTRNLEERLRTLPSVRSVGMTSMVPIRNYGSNVTRLTVVGRPDREAAFVELRGVTPGYFETLGVPLLQGRMLTLQDRNLDQPVVVINRELARQLFADGENPIGEVLNRGSGLQIVGVVGDVRQMGPDRRPRPTFYYLQEVSANLVVRASSDNAATIAAVRRTVAEIDPNVAILRVEQMGDIVSGSLGDRRFQLTLIGLFALSALLLGAVGIYGVMAYTIESQTREIGVRMALGAKAMDVLKMVLWRGGQLAIVGVVLGVAGAVAMRGVITTLLFDVSASDPVIFSGVAVLLVVVGVAACVIPARRASLLQPTEALRQE